MKLLTTCLEMKGKTYISEKIRKEVFTWKVYRNGLWGTLLKFI